MNLQNTDLYWDLLDPVTCASKEVFCGTFDHILVLDLESVCGNEHQFCFLLEQTIGPGRDANIR